LSGQEKALTARGQHGKQRRQNAGLALRGTLAERTFEKRYNSWSAPCFPLGWSDESDP
jgi:hypothetical protein